MATAFGGSKTGVDNVKGERIGVSCGTAFHVNVNAEVRYLLFPSVFTFLTSADAQR